jgi:hypothetical protein
LFRICSEWRKVKKLNWVSRVGYSEMYVSGAIPCRSTVVPGSAILAKCFAICSA